MSDDPTAEPGFCTSCGAELAVGHRFCGRCGHPASSDDPPAPTAEGSAASRRPATLTLVTVGFAVAAVVLGLVAWVLWPADDGPVERSIVGTITLVAEEYAGEVGEVCGLQFVPTVTVTPVGVGEPVTVEPPEGRIAQLFQCEFTYAVTGLPDAEAYEVQMRGDAGPRQYTRQELIDAGWQVDYRLGGLGG